MTSVSAATISDPGATFHLFGRLPLELRRMIWRAALPGPREVQLIPTYLENPEYPIVRNKEESEPESRVEDKLAMGNYFWEIFPPWGVQGFAIYGNSLPLLFYTCRESLDVASETYTLTFGSLGVKPRTWFRYNMDTLCVNPREYTGLLDVIDSLDQVKNLVYFFNLLRPRHENVSATSLYMSYVQSYPIQAYRPSNR